MSNKLRRDIVFGEEVIVHARYKPHTTIDARTFICEDGFGMYADTIGSAILGKWKQTGETGRIEGYMIDPSATKRSGS